MIRNISEYITGTVSSAGVGTELVTNGLARTSGLVRKVVWGAAALASGAVVVRQLWNLSRQVVPIYKYAPTIQQLTLIGELETPPQATVDKRIDLELIGPIVREYLGDDIPVPIYVKKLVNKVKCRMGNPEYTVANVGSVRHRLHQEATTMLEAIVEVNDSMRDADLYPIVKVALPLVFIPDDDDIAYSVVMAEPAFKSWLWKAYRHLSNWNGRWVSRAPIERMEAFQQPGK
jgi:hypothetical protein